MSTGADGLLTHLDVLHEDGKRRLSDCVGYGKAEAENGTGRSVVIRRHRIRAFFQVQPRPSSFPGVGLISRTASRESESRKKPSHFAGSMRFELKLS